MPLRRRSFQGRALLSTLSPRYVCSIRSDAARKLAVYFPDEIAKAAGLSDGQRVEIEMRDGEIVIRHCAPLSLEEMFKGKSVKEWRQAYGKAYDWGPNVGREKVDD
jgi:antitoxin component of MazEF toxin-antitoxin module